jgi:hypothetical protein
MSDPSAFSVIAGFALFLGFVFALAAALLWTARRFQPPARTGGQRNAPVRAGTTDDLCHGCEQVAPVQMYRGRRYCLRCAEELSALDQMAFEQAHREDFRRWEASS